MDNYGTRNLKFPFPKPGHDSYTRDHDYHKVSEEAAHSTNWYLLKCKRKFVLIGKPLPSIQMRTEIW